MQPGKGKKDLMTLTSLVTGPHLGLSLFLLPNPRTHQARRKAQEGEGGAAARGGCYGRRGRPHPARLPELHQGQGTDFKELISQLRFSAIETPGLGG